MRVTCKSCGAVYPIAPPPWVVSAGRPFRMVCARCGAAQEVMPTGLAILESDDVVVSSPTTTSAGAPVAPVPVAAAAPIEPAVVETLADPPRIVMPGPAFESADPFPGDELASGVPDPYDELLSGLDGRAYDDRAYDERGTILPSDTHVDAEVSGTFDAVADPSRDRFEGRFVLRQGDDLFHVADLATLQRWIVERRVEPTDALSEDGGNWHDAGSRADLAVFFSTVRQLEASARAPAAPDDARVPPKAAPKVAQPPAPAAPTPLAAVLAPATSPPSGRRRPLEITREREPEVVAGLAGFDDALDEFEQPTIPHVPLAIPRPVEAPRPVEPSRSVEPPRGRDLSVLAPHPPSRHMWTVQQWTGLGVAVGLAALLGITFAGQQGGSRGTARPAVVVASEIPMGSPSGDREAPPRVEAAPVAPVLAPAPTRIAEPVETRPAPRQPRPSVTATPAETQVPTTASVAPARAEPVRPRIEPTVRPTATTPAPTPAPTPTPTPTPTPSRPAPTIPEGASLSTLIDVGWQAVDVGDLATAFQAFDKAVGLDEASVPANYGLGYILLQRGRGTQARAYLCKALPLASGSDEHEIELLMADHGLSCR